MINRREAKKRPRSELGWNALAPLSRTSPQGVASKGMARVQKVGREIPVTASVERFEVVDAGSGQDVLSKGLDAVKARVSLVKTGQHVDYYIRVFFESQSWTVSRRYNEFAALSDTLKNKLASVPAVPSKSMVRQFAPEYLEARKNGLSSFLREVCRRRDAVNCREVQDFLLLRNRVPALAQPDASEPVQSAEVQEASFGIAHFEYDAVQGALLLGSSDFSWSSRVDTKITLQLCKFCLSLHYEFTNVSSGNIMWQHRAGRLETALWFRFSGARNIKMPWEKKAPNLPSAQMSLPAGPDGSDRFLAISAPACAPARQPSTPADMFQGKYAGADESGGWWRVLRAAGLLAATAAAAAAAWTAWAAEAKEESEELLLRVLSELQRRLFHVARDVAVISQDVRQHLKGNGVHIDEEQLRKELAVECRISEKFKKIQGEVLKSFGCSAETVATVTNGTAEEVRSHVEANKQMLADALGGSDLRLPPMLPGIEIPEDLTQERLLELYSQVQTLKIEKARTLADHTRRKRFSAQEGAPNERIRLFHSAAVFQRASVPRPGRITGLARQVAASCFLVTVVGWALSPSTWPLALILFDNIATQQEITTEVARLSQAAEEEVLEEHRDWLGKEGEIYHSALALHSRSADFQSRVADLDAEHRKGMINAFTGAWQQSPAELKFHMKGMNRFTSLITCVLIANCRDKATCLAGLSDGTIGILPMKAEMGSGSSGQVLPLVRHTAGVVAMALDETEQHLFSASSDKAIMVFDLRRQMIQCEVSAPSPPTHMIHCQDVA
eukprot:s1001_g1.t2